MSHILIVDDEESICWGLSRLLTADGHTVDVAASAEAALKAVGRGHPDAVVLDVRLPGMDGLTALPQLREQIGDVPVVVITAFGSLGTAVESLRCGAFDYLPKPFDLDQAAAVISRALSAHAPAHRHGGGLPIEEEEIVGSTPALQEVFKRIALVASSGVSVLIEGESGTGKELVARAIHRHSHRRTGPFVPVNLAALSPTIVESELFGHVRGAFTGAEMQRQGILELADGGTVLLDEAGDIPLPTQVKLLRALERKEIAPVGDARTRTTDFRLIAATNRNLRDEMMAGRFREDLYYRLSVFTIELPPLRERVADIPLLAERFLQNAGHSSDGDTTSGCYFLAETIEELQRRRWPGNVRELRNAVEHAALVARGGPIAVAHLPAELKPPRDTAEDLGRQLAETARRWTTRQTQQPPSGLGVYQDFLNVVEPAVFSAVLQCTDQNQTAASEMLGIHRTTLRKKLNEHGES